MSRNQPKQRRIRTHGRAQMDRRLQRHIRELGLKSEDEYRAWCLEHGLSKELHKTPFLQEKERELGRKLHGSFQGAVVSAYRVRPEGIRILKGGADNQRSARVQGVPRERRQTGWRRCVATAAKEGSELA